jgi:hypothetical protein
MATPTRSLGFIADRYEVIIATEPNRLSAYEIAKGTKAETTVWMMDGDRCCWQSTVNRILANPLTCASAILVRDECNRLANMVSKAMRSST